MNPRMTARWCAVSSFIFGFVLVALDKKDVAHLLFVTWAIFAAVSLLMDHLDGLSKRYQRTEEERQD